MEASHTCPTDWLTARSRLSPDREAVVDASSDQSRTFEELYRQSRARTTELAGVGVQPDTVVGLYIDDSPQLVEYLFAVATLGATAVPLDVALTASELSQRLDRVNMDVLVHDAPREDSVGDAMVQSETDPLAIEHGNAGDTLCDLESVSSGSIDPHPRGPDSVWLALFTSGTTGPPSAVALTERNLVSSAYASAARLGVDAGDRWASPLSMAHMGGIAPVLRSVLYGTTAITLNTTDPKRIIKRLKGTRATCLSIVPTLLGKLLDEGGPQAHDVLTGCRFVLCGGGPTSENLIRRCEEADIPICPTYGSTETASQIATATPEEAFVAPSTVGRPIPGLSVEIVGDGPLPPDEEGDIIVDGQMVSPGYLGTHSDSLKWSEYGLVTGDRGYMTEAGRLVVTGRADDTISTGGHTVDPSEVESVLLDHPTIQNAAVVGLPDEDWGELVGALIVGSARVQSIDRHCKTHLSSHKRPRKIAFIESIPRTSSGTVDRMQAQDHLQANGERIDK